MGPIERVKQKHTHILFQNVNKKSLIFKMKIKYNNTTVYE